MCGTPCRFNRLATFCPDNTAFTFLLPNSEMLLRRPVIFTGDDRNAAPNYGTPRRPAPFTPARGRNYR